MLTGTPIENRIDEIYSIVQYLDPGLLGPLFRFNRDFYELDERGRPVDYKNLDRTVPPPAAGDAAPPQGATSRSNCPAAPSKPTSSRMAEEQRLRYEEYRSAGRAARRRSPSGGR